MDISWPYFWYQTIDHQNTTTPFFFLSNQGMTQMPRVELESVDAKLKSSGETMASWGLSKIISRKIHYNWKF